MRCTILAVDDCDEILDILCVYLTEEGYAVLSTTRPLEALRIAEEEHVDLLLTDVIMPELSGLRLVERIRCSKPDMPVLLMSGFNDGGCTGYPLLHKPFRLTELLNKIRNLLDQCPSQPRA